MNAKTLILFQLLPKTHVKNISDNVKQILYFLSLYDPFQKSLIRFKLNV